MTADAADPGRPDDRLAAALRHAPDARLQAPPALAARLRTAARHAVRPRPWWRRALATPPRRLGASGAFASVLLAGVIGLLWRGEPPPPAEGSAPAAAPTKAAPPAPPVAAAVPAGPAAPPVVVAPSPAPKPAPATVPRTAPRTAPPPAAQTAPAVPPAPAAPAAEARADAAAAPAPEARAATAAPAPATADARRLAAAPQEPAAAWLAELEREVGPHWQPTDDPPPPLQRVGRSGIAFDHDGGTDRVWRCDGVGTAPTAAPACRRATLSPGAAERLRASRPTPR